MGKIKAPKVVTIIGVIEGFLCIAFGIQILIAVLSHLGNFGSHIDRILIRIAFGVGFLAIGGAHLYNIKLKKLWIFLLVTGVGVLLTFLLYQLVILPYNK